MRPLDTIGVLAQQLWRGSRTVRRAPLFSALVLLTVIAAVGANLIVFTLVRAVWLQPSPIVDPERVVVVAIDRDDGVKGVTVLTDLVPDEHFQELRRARGFDGVAGQVNDSGILGDGRPRVQFEAVNRPMETLAVTPNYFDVLGLPVRGRGFTAADDARGAPPVAIVSDQFWRTELDSQPDVIGRTVQTAYEPVTIVGIAPPGFRGARLGEKVDVWIPRGLTARMSMRAHAGFVPSFMPAVVVVARLESGLTVTEATQALDSPDYWWRYRLLPLPSLVGVPGRVTAPLGEQDLLAVALAMAALVLLAGCATLTTLMVVHLERRRRELAVRLALGCGRTRLTVGVLGEMVVLGTVGVALALAVTSWALAASRTLSLPGGLGLDRLDLSLDWRILVVALAIAAGSVLVAVLVGLNRLGRRTAVAGLVGVTATPPASSWRLRRGLLAVHAASTVVVLIGAALFVRTVGFAFSRGAGFDVDRTVFVSVQPSLFESYGRADPVFGDERRRLTRAAYDRLLSDLRVLPGVTTVALGEAPIRAGGMGGVGTGTTVVAAMTASTPTGERELPVGGHLGGAGYLEALGLPLLAGRLPDRRDRALITRSLAETLAPAGNPLGVALSSGDSSYEVVGVVPDFIQGSMSAGAAGGMIRLALTTEVFGVAGLSAVVRTASDADAAVPRIAEVVNRAFPLTARSRVVSGRELLAADLGRQRLGASFFSGFGLVALVLGAGGVFGLVAYLVESRARELGIRLALGATTGSLLLNVVRTSLGPVLTGTVIGLVAAAWLSGQVEALVFGVSAADAASYLAAGSLMAGSALLAGLAAGRRVRHVSPAAWLRQDS
jgi:predicted permease